MNFEEYVEFISNLDPDYFIGIHGVSGEGNYLEKIPSILEQGLKTNGGGGILSNVQIFNKVKDLTEEDFRQMSRYSYSTDKDDNIVNLVFAFPETYTTEDGREFYLGSFKRIPGYAKDHEEAGADNPLNKIVDKIGYIPKEFIVGYYTKKWGAEDVDFKTNPGFYPYVEGWDKYFEGLLDENHVMDLAEATERLNSLKNLPQLFDGEYYRKLAAYVEARLETEKKL